MHKLGCKVEIASNGKEAIDKLKENHFDLCLMDIKMPVLSGLDAIIEIRKNINKTIPIIALTAAVLKENEEECLKAGANSFLVKPINFDTLTNELKNFL